MIRRPEIDGLRAFAVAPVILFHAGTPGFGGGYLGVDLFFVISGYLIAGLVETESAAGTFSLSRFYERRARRILPALLLVLFACIPFAWVWMPMAALNAFARSLAGAAAFSSNFTFAGATGYFQAVGQERPLLHTWSLGVEEQFYVAFPLVMIVMRRLGLSLRLGVLAGIGALSLAHALTAGWSGDTRAFYWPQDRAWELLLGALAALAPRADGQGRDLPALAGAALIAAGYALPGAGAAFAGPASVLTALGGALVLRFARAGTGVARFLALAPFVGLGLVSYALYLWHQPLFAFAAMRNPGVLSALTIIGLIAVALTLAVLTTRLIEARLRDRARTPAAPLLSALAAISLLAVTAGLGLQRLDDGMAAAHWLRSPRLAEIGARLSPNFGLGEACDQGGAYAALESCADGPAPDVLVWGDSFAMQLMDGLAAANPSRRFQQATRSACSPLEGLALLDAKTGIAKARGCIAFNDAVLAELRAHPAIKDVVLSGSFAGALAPRAGLFDGKAAAPVSEGAVAAALSRAVRAIEALGRRVILVAPAPHPAGDVGACLEKAWLLDATPADCAFSRSEAERAQGPENGVFLQLQSQGVDVRWPADATCAAGPCAASGDDALLYRDSVHLSREGSAWLGRHGATLKLRAH